MTDDAKLGCLAVLWVIAVVGAIALSVWWSVYKFHDCERVGHSRLYCILDIGS